MDRSSMASFTKEVNPKLAKCPLKINGPLANSRWTSLVKEATGESPIFVLGLIGVLKIDDYSE